MVKSESLRRTRFPSKWSLLKRKGALVTLLWSFAGFSVFHFIVKIYSTSPVAVRYKYFDGIAACVAALSVPIISWAVDVRFGRYKVTKCSLFVMWLSTMVVYLLRVFHMLKLIPKGEPLNIAYSALILVMLVGLTVFQSNVIQLGTDQLNDSSTYEIVSYIILYAWTFSASEIMMQFTQVCFCTEYYAVANLLFPLVLSLALSSDFLFNHWLVKERVTQNPLKPVFQILLYAVKNKYPRQRSAFVDWEEKGYSRLDLAKTMYGGPFTSEQVENVKTLFRMLIVVSILSVLIGVLYHASNAITKISYVNVFKCTSLPPVSFIRICFKRLAIGNAGEIFVTLFLPVYQFLLLPILWNCTTRISILKKSGLGLMVLFVCLLCLFSIQLIKDIKQQDAMSNTTTTSCQLLNNMDAPYTAWLAAPSLMAGIGESVLLVSCAEFVSAQSPYSLRGTLFGFVCVGMIFSLFSGYVLTTAFSRTVWWQRTVLFECSLWFLVACIAVSGLLIIGFVVVSLWYKRRERDNNLPIHDQQSFAGLHYNDSENY